MYSPSRNKERPPVAASVNLTKSVIFVAKSEKKSVLIYPCTMRPGSMVTGCLPFLWRGSTKIGFRRLNDGGNGRSPLPMWRILFLGRPKCVGDANWCIFSKRNCHDRIFVRRDRESGKTCNFVQPCYNRYIVHALLAQGLEHCPHMAGVARSNRVVPTILRL